ncbi:MAG: hypothetical protein A3I44_05005 [Candidatus Sungbacteria bacterium RIFCSPLOWO2_02_FULL_51_17]|nr:MAG: hypothetical protein A3B29_02735 [Candidatus Sungbacteria bacterium RIFCSPLOWO2_01_FULL_51_34]OHA11699.1 MAG: hypothetical protein A3I44_05005 [Candidatus Sungbacteria bacterium RIFCSPLOWO2_02_FULL_51_17]
MPSGTKKKMARIFVGPCSHAQTKLERAIIVQSHRADEVVFVIQKIGKSRYCTSSRNGPMMAMKITANHSGKFLKK